MIVTPQTAGVRCTCTVDLLSRVFRPYNFLVTVKGEPPHTVTRRYKIAAPDEDSAAVSCMRLFEQEFMPKAIAHDMLTLEPKAKLQ
jgi:hypothetical protein